MIATSLARLKVISFSTDLGWIAVAGPEEGASLLSFGHRTQDDLKAAIQGWSATKATWDWHDEVREALCAYASGHYADFTILPLAPLTGTRFQQHVQEELCRVPYGATCTYAELAERAGSPGAARAVGTVMSRNPLPLLRPCHRIVGCGGGLGGYSAPQGLVMKRRLLLLEQQGLRQFQGLASKASL